MFCINYKLRGGIVIKNKLSGKFLLVYILFHSVYGFGQGLSPICIWGKNTGIQYKAAVITTGSHEVYMKYVEVHHEVYIVLYKRPLYLCIGSCCFIYPQMQKAPPVQFKLAVILA